MWRVARPRRGEGVRGGEGSGVNGPRERIAASPDGAYDEHWLAALEELTSEGAHPHEH